MLILLHKAGGSPSEWFSGSGSYAPYADKGHFIILAPESPGQSWGTGPKEWGYDYVAINRALEEAFARCAIDRSRLAIGGFSDGASYALSLGLANGDVFSYIIAFSPGFIVRAQLGDAEDMVSRENEWNGRNLDWSRLGVTRIPNRLQNLR